MNAHESITVAATAIGITAGLLNADSEKPIERAILTLETAQVRWTIDGTTPTSSVGHLMEVGDQLILEGYEDIAKFKAIRTGGVSGVLKASIV